MGAELPAQRRILDAIQAGGGRKLISSASLAGCELAVKIANLIGDFNGFKVSHVSRAFCVSPRSGPERAQRGSSMDVNGVVETITEIYADVAEDDGKSLLSCGRSPICSGQPF
ncbi:hypothetical protein [Mesorhizobium carmichaelinearum]|uniref:hypothetical protein n=1 Tax=Mesorhizobium carmichaelinearum TaxID=1208188 RepID=UPI0015CA006F|nr:hypothetical protein [Mesorhizobium carmichaelinearum]